MQEHHRHQQLQIFPLLLPEESGKESGYDKDTVINSLLFSFYFIDKATMFDVGRIGMAPSHLQREKKKRREKKFTKWNILVMFFYIHIT